MRITNLRIQNYRGIRDVTVPMSSFGCLIGENNAGKSSILQALSLFFSGTKLAPHNYFDAIQPIRIDLTFEDITTQDLERLENEEHRTRIGAYAVNGKLMLCRLYDTDGKSSLKIVRMVPLDSRFASDQVANLMKNKRAGATFSAAIIEQFPELAGKMTESTDQAGARALIEALGDSFPDTQKQVADVDLPTGFDKTIAALLPEPIYIPAVKDLADEIKTTESASFGKLLGILFRAIEGELGNAQEVFEKLHSQLNRVTQPDGTVIDGRLEQVKAIERTVQSYLRESFPNVSLQFDIPPAEVADRPFKRPDHRRRWNARFYRLQGGWA